MDVASDRTGQVYLHLRKYSGCLLGLSRGSLKVRKERVWWLNCLMEWVLKSSKLCYPSLIHAGFRVLGGGVECQFEVSAENFQDARGKMD